MSSDRLAYNNVNRDNDNDVNDVNDVTDDNDDNDVNDNDDINDVAASIKIITLFPREILTRRRKVGLRRRRRVDPKL